MKLNLKSNRADSKNTRQSSIDLTRFELISAQMSQKKKITILNPMKGPLFS